MITGIPTKGSEQASTSQGEPNASNEESSLKLFTKSAIMNATNKLSKESMIGSGGFGNVYKGTIDNVEVAIKILDAKSTQGEKEFFQEMTVLEDLKHENLVKLMGVCLKQRALVYEFLPRGSLEDCLNKCPQLLTWQIRTRIVYEICSVLMFLHSLKPKPVVHGDLKPHNILLDADLHCRLSDFGLCRFLPEFSVTTGAYLQTQSINGTDSYIDPVYLEFGKLTPGCDVYSFGVTILRILTGQPPFRICKKVRRASKSNSLMTVVDSTAGDWPVEVAEYLAKSGIGCCKDNRNNLKLMTELSTFLEDLAEKGSKPAIVLSNVNVNLDWRGMDSENIEPLQPSNNNYKEEKSVRPSFKLYSEEEIRDATKNFRQSYLIGKGEYGTVYKCKLDNWDVAVKLLKGTSDEGPIEFVKEMKVLWRMSHENIVHLMGACSELCALIYEYIPNGSLEKCLVERPTELTWQTRTRILYEICKGIMYLHATEVLVHGDLRPHNVLLDDDGFKVKLTDFGLIQILTQGQASKAHHYTINISGPSDYMDPDYIERGKVTPAVDVYALGKTVVRILTGKQPHDVFAKLHAASKSGSLMKIVDPTVRDWPENVVKTLARFALRSRRLDRYGSEFMRKFYSDLEKILDDIDH